MTIFYIKMKIRAGGGSFRAGGGALGQQGALPCFSSLWETLEMCRPTSANSEDLHVDEMPHHGLHYLLIQRASMFTHVNGWQCFVFMQ